MVLGILTKLTLEFLFYGGRSYCYFCILFFPSLCILSRFLLWELFGIVVTSNIIICNCKV